jgi:transcription antitermination factor NusG
MIENMFPVVLDRVKKFRNFLSGMSLYLINHVRRLHLLRAMSVLSDFRWFAVHCRPGMENLVDFRLRAMLIETLLPLTRESTACPERSSGGPVHPLFHGYLFANFCIANSLRTVALSRGVLRVVSKKGRPVPVQEAIIASLRERLDSEGFVQLCEGRAPRRKSMRIASGPLRNWPAVFERHLSDQRRVRILIQTLQKLPEISEEPRTEVTRSRPVPQRDFRKGLIGQLQPMARTL